MCLSMSTKKAFIIVKWLLFELQKQIYFAKYLLLNIQLSKVRIYAVSSSVTTILEEFHETLEIPKYESVLRT